MLSESSEGMSARNRRLQSVELARNGLYVFLIKPIWRICSFDLTLWRARGILSSHDQPISSLAGGECEWLPILNFKENQVDRTRNYLEVPYAELEDLNLKAKEHRQGRVAIEKIQEERLKYLTDEKRSRP